MKATILEKIVNNRHRLLTEEKKDLGEKEIVQKAEFLFESGYRPVPFADGLRDRTLSIIAEIKKASPSRGIIRKNFDVKEIAGIYGSSKSVKAISVLTEPDFFSGSYDYIQQAREAANKPVLMKDFIIDPYQVYKGFLSGASAILLISSILDDIQLDNLKKTAGSLNLQVLFETHSSEEYRRALNYNFDMIGINNRDLKTFATDINTTIKILDECGRPDCVIISESGIKSKKDIEMLSGCGVDGFLIGETFMKSENIREAIIFLAGDAR